MSQLIAINSWLYFPPKSRDIACRESAAPPTPKKTVQRLRVWDIPTLTQGTASHVFEAIAEAHSDGGAQ
jgi:hypothetical protein